MGFRAWAVQVGPDQCEVVVSGIQEHHGQRVLELYLIDPNATDPVLHREAALGFGVPAEDFDVAMFQEAALTALVDEFRQSGDEARRRGRLRFRDDPSDGELLRRLALLPSRHNALRELQKRTQDRELWKALGDALQRGPIEVRIIE